MSDYEETTEPASNGRAPPDAGSTLTRVLVFIMQVAFIGMVALVAYIILTGLGRLAYWLTVG